MAPGGIGTDLPLVPDKPVDFGLQDFCEKCSLCAEKCPSGALSKGGREVVRGYLKWHMDAEKCYTYWCTTGHPCGVCQSVCPWNHANNRWHNGMRELAQRVPALTKTLLKAEEIFYNHRKRPEPKWMSEKVNFTLIK